MISTPSARLRLPWALRSLLSRRRRRRIGNAIIAGYRRLPETAEELAWAEAATLAMIEEEPW